MDTSNTACAVGALLALGLQRKEKKSEGLREKVERLACLLVIWFRIYLMKIMSSVYSKKSRSR